MNQKYLFATYSPRVAVVDLRSCRHTCTCITVYMVHVLWGDVPVHIQYKCTYGSF